MRIENAQIVTKKRRRCLCSHLLSMFSHYNRLLDTFSDEMMVYLDVLRLSVENWVPS